MRCVQKVGNISSKMIRHVLMLPTLEEFIGETESEHTQNHLVP